LVRCGCGQWRQREGARPGVFATPGRAFPSFGRVPDDGEEVRVILTGGAGKIGVELARTELRRREAEAYILLAGFLAGLAPARADLEAIGDDPEVGLIAGLLRRIGRDLDLDMYAGRIDKVEITSRSVFRPVQEARRARGGADLNITAPGI
jgi:hypothetical protein